MSDEGEKSPSSEPGDAAGTDPGGPVGVDDVIRFWFDTIEPSDWYKRSETLDARIARRFMSTYRCAVAGELDHWRDAPEGRLAEIIVLDQFSRNMFRGSGQAFAADPLALALAQAAVRAGADRAFDDRERAFVYMPYMHSESARVHERAMELFADLPQSLDFEKRHKAIIDRFGRYPYRNVLLGRESTPEELTWLETNKGF